MANSKLSNDQDIENQIPVEENIPEKTSGPVVYTEERVKLLYNEGQKSGYISALKQARSEINDYLSDLIASAKALNKE